MDLHCAVCKVVFSSNQALTKHQRKKNKCGQGKYKCNKGCDRSFKSREGRKNHAASCQGREKTHEDKNIEIEHLKNALAASNGLQHELQSKKQQIQQQIVNNNTTNNIDIDQINNVTQNIVILNCGEENIEHFRGMPFEQLKEKIGLNRNPTTHIEAYKLIHLDPEHPENHNMLLTDRNSDKVHFFGNNEWNQGSFDEQIRLAVFDTNKAIQRTIPEKKRDDYYWNHLEHGIGTKCNNRDDAALRPIFDGLRDPLHQSTMRLMKIPQKNDQPEDLSSISNRVEGVSESIVIEIEKTKRAQIEAATREKEAAHKTRQLELQVELARLNQKL